MKALNELDGPAPQRAAAQAPMQRQPTLLQQIRMYRDDAGKPSACVLWAKMNEESEQRLLDGSTHMRPQDWNSGDCHWIIDVISSQTPERKIGRGSESVGL